MEGEPLISKCHATSVFDVDSPEEAKREKPFMVSNQLRSSSSQTQIRGKNVKTEKINGIFQS
jgi:hypothetical protein